MKFKSVAEAFNNWRNKSIEEMQRRAQEIQNTIDTDADADIEALNIELRGLKEARENIELRSADNRQTEKSFNVVTGMSTQKQGGKTFTPDTVYDTPEYRSAFFKTMLGQTLNAVEKSAYDVGMAEAAKRSDAFISSTEAAAVLPTSTLNEIVKKARTLGGLMAECRAFNMPTKIAIPVGTPSSAAAWHTEGATVETEALTPDSVTFDGFEIIKIFSISLKARRMAIPAFESYLVDELTACVMQTIEAAIVNGTGSGQGTGIENGVTWVTSGDNKNCIQIAANKQFTTFDIVEALALLKRGYSRNAKFAMNNATLYRSIYNLMDGEGRPIFFNDMQNGKVGRILGHDIIVDDNISDDVIYIGDFAAYMAYNIPEGIVMEASRDSGFRKGLIDYRATAIADCKPIAEAFVKLCKAAQ